MAAGAAYGRWRKLWSKLLAWREAAMTWYVPTLLSVSLVALLILTFWQTERLRAQERVLVQRRVTVPRGSDQRGYIGFNVAGAGSAAQPPLDPRYYASVRIAISLILLVACLYVVLSRQYEAGDKNWAYGTIGALTGYWLKH